jgi:putative hemolysin
MLQLADHLVHLRSKTFAVRLAHTSSEIVEAQRLRYRVFAEELGARLDARTPGVDQDIFDPYCDHLIVRDEAHDRIVGTYRILAPGQAEKIGCYYSETEFDLVRLRHLRARMAEIGRSCIDAEYRTGPVITLLWSGLARYMMQRGYEYLIGCASIGMADGGHNAATLYYQLREHMAPLEYHVFPRCRLPLEKLANGGTAELPPLLKGYLRAGAYVCGEPAWDPNFNTADLLLLLPMSAVTNRYARHFIERQK